MRTIREYAFLPTPPEEPEYGLLFVEDEAGKHWTLRGDVELVKMIRDAPPEARADTMVGGVWEEREGWPDEW